MTRPPSQCPVAVLGPGKVGTTIALLLQRTGFPIAAIGARKPVRAATAASRFSPQPAAGSLEEAAAAAEIVLLTVSDDAIGPVSASLAASGCVRPGSIWLHCSGALPAAEMSPLKQHGCILGSMHPLQTFPSVEAGVDRMRGALVACEGDEPAVKWAMLAASTIGAHPVRIAPEAKLLYHAAAVIACNGLVTLVDAALELDEHAGLSREAATSGLNAILNTTLQNILESGTDIALTGPAARGDHVTIKRQLTALNRPQTKEIFDLYTALTTRASSIAARRGTITHAQREQILASLRLPPNNKDNPGPPA